MAESGETTALEEQQAAWRQRETVLSELHADITEDLYGNLITGHISADEVCLENSPAYVYLHFLYVVWESLMS